jgi:hypothetical protein
MLTGYLRLDISTSSKVAHFYGSEKKKDIGSKKIIPGLKAMIDGLTVGLNCNVIGLFEATHCQSGEWTVNNREF